MNLNYRLGSAFNRAIHWVLSASWFPLTHYAPRGRYWMYDIQRYSGRRDLGVIFDVGANVGQTAWGLVRYFPRSPIYCFEPVCDTFEALQERYGSKVHCERMALGAQSSAETIQLHRNSELNSFRPTRQYTEKIGTEVVLISMLDEFCSQRSID
jgi:FkbM family methyltransferase